MNDPIQLLYLGPKAPDLSTSAWGPFVVHGVSSREELQVAADQQRYHAVVLVTADQGLGDVVNWPALTRLVLESAVVVIAPEPATTDALRLLQRGVQDVLPQRDAGADNLARAVRMAIARTEIDRSARKAYATDLATGLPNHSQLMEHMTHLLALREREPAAMALIALRIDGLGSTEQRLGAEAANVLRRKLAVRLRAQLRASDVVASVGQDSFAVLLAWVVDAADGDSVAGKLARALQLPFAVSGQDVAVSVRLGVSQYPAHGKQADGLLARALDLAGLARPQGRVGLSRQDSANAAANDE